jgi:hypothetical protein
MSVSAANRLRIDIPPALATRFRLAAAERDVDVDVLMRRLLSAVAGTRANEFRDNLITAILDDQDA